MRQVRAVHEPVLTLVNTLIFCTVQRSIDRGQLPCEKCRQLPHRGLAIARLRVHGNTDCHSQCAHWLRNDADRDGTVSTDEDSRPNEVDIPWFVLIALD